MFPAPTSVTVTGCAVTVIAALPLRPSLVAVIVAEPSAAPVTSPVADTLTTSGAPLAHVTARPTNGLPLASLGVAVSCTVPPTATPALAGVTSTEATGALVIVAVVVAGGAGAPFAAVSGRGGGEVPAASEGDCGVAPLHV